MPPGSFQSGAWPRPRTSRCCSGVANTPHTGELQLSGVTERGEFRADLECEQFAHDLHGVILGYHNARRLLRDPHAERRAHRGFASLVAAAAAGAANNVSSVAKAS